MTVECKGSVELGELVKGIGQCIAHSYYGNNIVCFAIPEDKKEQAILLVNKISVAGGKIGLFVVKKDGAHLSRNWKELTPTRLSKRIDNYEDVLKLVRDPFIEYILLGIINKGTVYPVFDARKPKKAQVKVFKFYKQVSDLQYT